MNFPTELKYTKEHVWVKVEGDTAKLGITEYAQDQLGDILFVDLPEDGDTLTKGENFTEVESSKTASELSAPVSGEIIAVNSALDDEPEAINEDAFAAWIVEVKLDDAADLNDLMDADAYKAICE